MGEGQMYKQLQKDMRWRKPKKEKVVTEKHFDPCEACQSTYPCEETCGDYLRLEAVL